ncbi:hypothetical protein EU527_16105 [Candidatus Thorarchaeota archaeon]|nr:MAG: hypothetical protein EU527_16105 [Candidatus Thorarchaeota archaeon]
MVFNPLGTGLELVWDIIAMIISIVAVMLVVIINGAIQKSGKLSSDVTRKIVHIFAAPVFLVTWWLYSGSIFSRYLALIVPILFVLLFVGIGTGKVVNEAFVGSMSRSGEASELLKGTLYYALIICIVTVLWFYSPGGSSIISPTAFVILGCLAGGDGLADVIGRKYGGDRKFGIGGAEKTIAGSIGMFIGSFLFSYILAALFLFDLVAILIPILVISIVVTIVEALSPKNLDNWTVPIVVVIMIVLFIYLVPAWWPFALLTL